MNRVITRGLMGAAAGLAMVSGAQAADMPVKAKPVEYVKICSAYGAGFYYIPGTDICLRVGGYVYYEFGVKGSSAIATIYESLGGDDPINQSYDYYNSRASAKVILDARQNTAYGTLRATMSVGPTNVNHVNTVGMDYAYIQFAGFTWGYTNSFYSFGGAYSVVANPALDWSWINTFAYTAQLGNGVTASLAVEDPEGRRANISPYGGRWSPDIVGNFNVTQAWGRAQIMGAAHQIKPSSGSGLDSEWGWALGAGIEVKTPQTGNANNSFLLQGTWTEGAVDYTGYNSSPTAAAAGTTIAIQNWAGTGPVFAVRDFFGSGGNVELVEAWSVYAAYRHYWTPMLRTGFFAGWLNIDEGSDVNSAGELEVLQAGISTVWSPVAGLDLSLDIVYSDVEETTLAGVTFQNDIITAWTRLRRNF
jgi:hypothetical protein